MKDHSGSHEAIVLPPIPPEDTENNENNGIQKNSPLLKNGPEIDSAERQHTKENGNLSDGKYDSVRYCPGAPEKNEELLKMMDKSEDEAGSEKLIANSNNQQESKTPSVVAEEDMAPDGGWGWIVVAAASFVLMSVDTIGQCFGIIFSGFLLDRGASSLTTAWMINMFTFFFCVTGLPLASLIQEFGWRRIALVASLMLFTATVSSAFANAIWVLYFTFSLLAGISCGMLLNISYIIVPYYFNRRRGLASGIIMALDSSGQIVAPPLVKWLQDEFAYKGATLILGGIVLNCFVAAAVFHPVEWHSKLGPRRERRATQNARSEYGKSRLAGLHSNATQFLASMLANLRVLRYVKAIVIALGATLFLCGYQNFMAFMPFVVQDAGYTLGDAAQCVSVSAVFNMITRLTVAWLSDSSWFSYRVSLMFSSAVLTVTLIVFSLLRDIKWMIALMCIYGIGVGSYMCLFSLVMVHYFGLDKLVSMMGATMLVTSVSNITIGPMAGLVRDLTGSYSACIWVLAGLSFCSFLLWFFMPLAVRFDDSKKKKKRKKYANDA